MKHQRLIRKHQVDLQTKNADLQHQGTIVRKKKENTDIVTSYTLIKSTMSNRSFPFRFLSHSIRARLMSRERRTPVRITCINCDVKLSSPCTDSAASNETTPSIFRDDMTRPRLSPDFFFDDFGDPH